MFLMDILDKISEYNRTGVWPKKNAAPPPRRWKLVRLGSQEREEWRARCAALERRAVDAERERDGLRRKLAVSESEKNGLLEKFDALEKEARPLLIREISRRLRRLAKDRRPVVKLDGASLARIREDAVQTQAALAVDYDGADVVFEPPPYSPPVARESTWDDLRDSLSGLETAAIAVVLAGGDLAEYARGIGVMPEVLADGINGKAVDIVGDCILDTVDGFIVYEDYMASVSMWR